MKLSIRGIPPIVACLVLMFACVQRGVALEPSVGQEKTGKTAKQEKTAKKPAAKARRLTFIFGGVADEKRARLLRKTLRKIEGVRFKAKQLEAGEEPRYSSRLVVRIADLEKAPIGSLAKAVADADLPGKDEIEPTVNLALFTTRDISEESVMALRRELTGVRGIVPTVPGGLGGLIEDSLYWVRLDNTGEARLEDVLEAARRAEPGLTLAPRKQKKEKGTKKTEGAKKALATERKWDGEPSAVPEELRGFSGLLRGELMSKDVERGTLVVRVDEVRKVWKPSTAKKPASAVGEYLRVDGIAGKWLDVLLLMEPGDAIELEAHHKVGRNLSFLPEWLKKVSPEKKSTETEIPAGFRGFRGIFSGRLVSKDVEKGTLVVKVEKINKTWKQNKAESPESAFGRSLTVKGVAGKWLDVLLVLEFGDRIEIEAFDNGAAHLDFVKEWLKKVE